MTSAHTSDFVTAEPLIAKNRTSKEKRKLLTKKICEIQATYLPVHQSVAVVSVFIVLAVAVCRNRRRGLILEEANYVKQTKSLD